MTNIKTILFDLDGTMVDTAPDLGLALNMQRERHGLPPLAQETIRPFASHGSRGLLGIGFELTPADDTFAAMRDEYRRRSPIHAVDRLSCPLILFQGLEDKVVPPNQSEMMADALRAKGLPVAYLAFEGEQHGFRRADSIIRSLEAELWFYGAVFGFSPADPIAPLHIDNAERLPARV